MSRFVLKKLLLIVGFGANAKFTEDPLMALFLVPFFPHSGVKFMWEIQVTGNGCMYGGS